MKKSKVTLEGSAKCGFVITVEADDNFVGDLPITHEEAKMLLELLKKKLKYVQR
jgi:hypothetical protein